MTVPVIAVLDDDPGMQDLLRELLEEAGYAVRRVPVSPAAVAGLTAQRPALVVLDVSPYSAPDGWYVLDALCRTPATQEIPLIVWSTSLTALQDRVDALPTRRCRVVAKPFDVNELLNLMHTLVVEARAAPSDAAATSA